MQASQGFVDECDTFAGGLEEELIVVAMEFAVEVRQLLGVQIASVGRLIVRILRDPVSRI